MPVLKPSVLAAAALAVLAVPALTGSGGATASPGAGSQASRPAYRSLTGTGPAVSAPGAPRAAAVAVNVQTIATGLSIPWDLTFTPAGAMIVTERAGRLLVKPRNGSLRPVAANLSDVYVNGEGGLLGIVVDPAFRANRLFYTCMDYRGTGTAPIDVRVIRWRLSLDLSSATRVGSPVVAGLPVSDGRHSGCRLRFDRDGKLRVATGDAAQGTNPQNLQSLGGKTLRVNADGTIPADNPFFALGGKARYVWTYGHRNVQGLAMRPGSRQVWTAEHGPDRDDEVNLLAKGGNYGWDPVPGYNERVPMTDLTKFPDARVAKWSSGFPTVATSGATFLDGAAWGRWRGALVVAELKGSAAMVLTLDAAGTVVRREQITALDGTFGRLRTVQLGPDGALYVTTSNGTADKILRVTPAG
ncbi:MAG TPA: PQQ-dependent sugar dehydrogenase [Dermatophilaceae bacterium]|nr:PQQ-dependent sugar dehydrogenase [Dermatophilaceae bacterium]